MTPLQTQAFLSEAAEIHREELAEKLAIEALAASGNAEAIKAQLKQLLGEG